MKRWIGAMLAATLVLLSGCAEPQALELARRARAAVEQQTTVSFDLKMTHRPTTPAYGNNVIDQVNTVEGFVEVGWPLQENMQAQLTLSTYTSTTYEATASPFGGRGGTRTSRTLNGPATGYYADGAFYYDMGEGMYWADLTGTALYGTLANLTVPAGSIANLSIGGGNGFTGFDNTVADFDVVNGSDLANQINALFGILFPERVGTLTGIHCTFALNSATGLPHAATFAFTNAFASNAEYTLELTNFRYSEAVNITVPTNLASYSER